jgi:hypothetical protein
MIDGRRVARAGAAAMVMTNILALRYIAQVHSCTTDQLVATKQYRAAYFSRILV